MGRAGEEKRKTVDEKSGKRESGPSSVTALRRAEKAEMNLSLLIGLNNKGTKERSDGTQVVGAELSTFHAQLAFTRSVGNVIFISHIRHLAFMQGCHRAAGSVPADKRKHQTRNDMAKVKLNLKNKTDNDLQQFSTDHIAAMDGNANFPNPDPTVADFQALATLYKSSLQKANAAQQTAREKMRLKDAARVALEEALITRGAYVDMKSKGDEAVILSSGLPVRDVPSPVGALPAPQSFRVKMGTHPGEIKLQCKRMRGAVSFIAQQSPNVMPRVWTQIVVVTNGRATATGLTSGQSYSFRMAAVGAAGQGPWTDEVVKMSP